MKAAGQAPVAGPSETLDSIPEEFAGVYRTYYSRLVRALQMSGARQEQAEEIAQEAFARALPHWGRISKGANPPGYVFKTAFRLLRRPSRLIPVARRAAPVGVDVEGEALALIALRHAVRALPRRRRECFALCLGAGLDVDTAAAILHIRPVTVRTQLHLARQAVTSALDGQAPLSPRTPKS